MPPWENQSGGFLYQSWRESGSTSTKRNAGTTDTTQPYLEIDLLVWLCVDVHPVEAIMLAFDYGWTRATARGEEARA